MLQKLRTAIVAIVCTVASLSANADLVDTFQSGIAGWVGSGGTVSYSATGGNGGGFLQEQDVDNTLMGVFVPGLFRGNLSQYLGGTISFDGKNINNSPADLVATPGFAYVYIYGANSSIFASRLLDGGGAGSPPPDGNWHNYSSTLTPSLWAGDLTATLASVTNIFIRLEYGNQIGGEVAGLDNVAVRAVPEPTTSILLFLGLVTVLYRRQFCVAA